MEPYDRKSSNAAGTAAVRQAEHPSSAAREEQPVEERAARVAELREQYQRGAYQVDPAALSSEIVTKHLKK